MQIARWNGEPASPQAHAALDAAERAFSAARSLVWQFRVATLRGELMQKLGLSHRSELVRFALQTGVLKAT